MAPILIAVVAVLALAVVWLAAAMRRRSRGFAYIRRKLNDIVAGGTAEQVLLHTGDRGLRELLVAVNRLLAAGSRTKAEYARKEAAQRTLLANLAHDLKTPLTVVLGVTETLAGDAPPDDRTERSRLAAKVHGKAEEMRGLMNRYFELAALEAGDRELPLGKLDAAELCRSGVLFFYESIEAHGLQAAIDIPDRPLFALANEDAASRVLHNLLSNAIRYGGDGGVVGLAAREEGDHIAIEVWDRGKGIDERHRQLVFERLYTLEDSRNRAFQGSGLGLAIARSLAERMGGTLSLDSRPGERTAFTLRLKRM